MIMGVDEGELREVMRIGMLVIWLYPRCSLWVIGVIHARAEVQIEGIDILMIEPQGVRNLLTHHGALARDVRRSVVVVVDHRPGHIDVADIRIFPHLCESSPTGITIVGTAHLDPARHGIADNGIAPARYGREIDDTGCR